MTSAPAQAQNHFYDGWIYRNFLDPSLGSIRRRISKHVPDASRVMDVGCGTGDQLFFLAPKISSGLGIELSQKMITTARQQLRIRGHAHLDFELADASRLDHLEDNAFDIAMASMMIHEMPESKRLPVIKEMKRVAQQLIFADWIYPQPSRWKHMATHSIEFLAGREHYAGFRSYMKAGGMPALLELAGLHIHHAETTTKGTIQIWLCS